jgi:hypothetical protein
MHNAIAIATCLQTASTASTAGPAFRWMSTQAELLQALSMMQDIGLQLVTKVLAGPAATITFNNDKLVRAVGFTLLDQIPGASVGECITMIHRSDSAGLSKYG